MFLQFGPHQGLAINPTLPIIVGSMHIVISLVLPFNFFSDHAPFASQTLESHFTFIPVGSKTKQLTTIVSDPIDFPKGDADV